MDLSRLDWEAVGTIVALLGVLVSFVFNIVSNRAARVGQEQQRVIAEAAADRAEQATRVSHGYTERVVDALERIAAGGLNGATVPARVRWELVHHAGDTYRLTNIGDAPAADVDLSAHDTLGVGHFIGGPDLGPGEALTFMAAPDMATRDSTITVEWGDPSGGHRQRWRYPLPAGPR